MDGFDTLQLDLTQKGTLKQRKKGNIRLGAKETGKTGEATELGRIASPLGRFA